MALLQAAIFPQDSNDFCQSHRMASTDILKQNVIQNEETRKATKR
jgi:hypothetical protein